MHMIYPKRTLIMVAIAFHFLAPSENRFNQRPLLAPIRAGAEDSLTSSLTAGRNGTYQSS